MGLDQIRIVLVEPMGALNVGSIARIMKNMELRQLVLVNPRCDWLGPEARQMAVHAADVLEAAQRVDRLPDALKGCDRAIATTGREETTVTIPLEHPRVALPFLLREDQPTEMLHQESALIFGREDRGLTNEELYYAQRLIYVPTSSAYSSLNLAQAVAICCYELHNLRSVSVGAAPMGNGQQVKLGAIATNGPPAAPLDSLEAFYQQLEALLLKIGYLYPHTAKSRMKKFRRLLSRAYPSEEEVIMLRGILRQVEWALANERADGGVEE